MSGQQANMGNERSTSSGSSRKSKKDKPKVPQRGLGVAQLERLRHQMAYSYVNVPCPHPPFPTPLTQDDMRMQGVYAPPLMQSSASFAYPQSQSLPSCYGYPPNTIMGMGDMETTNIRYGIESQPRWSPNNVAQEDHHQQYQQYANSSGMSTRSLDLHHAEVSTQNTRRTNLFEALGSSSPNSESSNDNQEVDLELRLSI